MKCIDTLHIYYRHTQTHKTELVSEFLGKKLDGNYGGYSYRNATVIA